MDGAPQPPCNQDLEYFHYSKLLPCSQASPPTPQSLTPTGAISGPVVLPFPETRVKGITQPVAFGLPPLTASLHEPEKQHAVYAPARCWAVCHRLSVPLQTLAGSCGKFAPFEIKEHMVLAPRCRTAFDQDLCDKLDQLLQRQSSEFSFLKELKGRQPIRSGPTVVSNRNADIFNRSVHRETITCPLGDLGSAPSSGL